MTQRITYKYNPRAQSNSQTAFVLAESEQLSTWFSGLFRYFMITEWSVCIPLISYTRVTSLCLEFSRERFELREEPGTTPRSTAMKSQDGKPGFLVYFSCLG
ncbi:uncharacterized protein MELLADRAFT_95262 [Melampsora larici-populina 98AG31]|uniref:Uncharacterized protein n=1 Tax=Melampsora larici-populina (strain 98AG31 / pathotype 3-4-7) TaxID=747676 RepID=F4RCT7_MELLP|nr:uncharacterized protein MELLADRAFT_95262 [Melampsora larici-populina 98AG31]EGG09778.1 hypothetical protein MELLADRAFT_95262 [Melampsora larici-populina 98AG31]